MAMYQLGTMVESWYGTPQFIFLYGMTAGGGNLVSVLIRHQIGANPHVHSGGGSVVIMGLVGLCAVAGLRSRTKMGVSLGRIMVFFIVVTAVIGAVISTVHRQLGPCRRWACGNRAGLRPPRLRQGRDANRLPGVGDSDGDRDCGVWRGPGRRRQTGSTRANRTKPTFAGGHARKEPIKCSLGRRHSFASEPMACTIVKLLDSLRGVSAGNDLPADEIDDLRRRAEAAGRPSSFGCRCQGISTRPCPGFSTRLAVITRPSAKNCGSFATMPGSGDHKDRRQTRSAAKAVREMPRRSDRSGASIARSQIKPARWPGRRPGGAGPGLCDRAARPRSRPASRLVRRTP